MKTLTFLFIFALLPTQLSDASVSLSILEPDHNFFSGEKVQRTILLESDLPERSEAVLRWETLVRPAVIERGEKKIDLKPGQKRCMKVNLTMPEIKRRAKLIWRIQLLLNGKKPLESEFHYSVFPKDIPANVKDILSDKKIGIYDPQGKTRKILRDLAIEFQDLRTQLSLETFQGELVIIGSGVPGRQLSNTLLTLEEKVKEGMPILCLEQSESINQFLIPMETVSPKPTDISLSRISALNHPVFQEMEEADLSNWSGDGIISRYPYQAPVNGNFRILTRTQLSLRFSGVLKLDLATMPLIELPYGQGKFIFCQMLVNEKFKEEPVARLLFENLIAYALIKTKPLEPAAIFGDSESGMMKVLDSLKVAGPRNPARLNGINFAIICADEQSIELILRQDRTLPLRLRKFIQEGASLLIFNLVPETLDFFKEIIPHKISLKDYSHQEAVELESKSSLLWGIADEDIELILQVQEEEEALKYILEFEEGEEAKSLMEPAGIAKFLLGKGQIVVCQIPFREDSERSLSTLSQLLTNLGVEIVEERW